jgi:Ni/Co efflux regulator RcnB
VKKLKYFCSAILALSLLAIPAVAQKGKDRDNKGAVNTGAARADLVKDTNKTPRKGKDNDKNDNKGKRKGFTHGKHKGRR